MIKVTALDTNFTHEVKPTIFPDGTSQIWKLPKEILDSSMTMVTWYYENDAELMHIGSLKQLLKKSKFTRLHMPFLPYGRQDKKVFNDTTFNLEVFAKIINAFEFTMVSSVDTHNYPRTVELINNFVNYEVEDTIRDLQNKLDITKTVFPDFGARMRYNVSNDRSTIIGHKVRDQLTGNITDYELEFPELTQTDKLLIVDDICDGGATFIKLVNKIKELQPNVEINLFVTHGIFSKGKQILLDAGIKNIYTTNSLLQNKEGIEV